jgi:hypothetical protein
VRKTNNIGIRRKDQEVGLREGREFDEDRSTNFGKLEWQSDRHREGELCSFGDLG